MVNKVLRKIGSNFAALALLVGVISTSQSCHFFLNQQEVPEKMKKIIEEKRK